MTGCSHDVIGVSTMHLIHIVCVVERAHDFVDVIMWLLLLTREKMLNLQPVYFVNKVEKKMSI